MKKTTLFLTISFHATTLFACNYNVLRKVTIYLDGDLCTLVTAKIDDEKSIRVKLYPDKSIETELPNGEFTELTFYSDFKEANKKSTEPIKSLIRLLGHTQN